MSAKSYSLIYDGYWREPNIKGIPAKSGVYSVYACTYDRAQQTVDLRKLIYIGESHDVRVRISRHEKWKAWRRHLNAGEQLCFNFAPIATERLRVEAALINHHKPPENTEFVRDFPYDQTTVETGGRSTLLSRRFTVYRTRYRSPVYQH